MVIRPAQHETGTVDAARADARAQAGRIYVSGLLHVHAWRSAPTGPGDRYWSAAPEAHRAYLNTTDYADARGL